MLQLAGIDMGIFSAHSIRGASTSEALRQGISITEILGMADWSQESTFSNYNWRLCKSVCRCSIILII